MKITTTRFESNCHGVQVAGNNTYGRYVLVGIDVFNDIIVDDIALNAVYQTATGYDHNDYSCPSPELGLSDGGGAHAVLCKVDSLYATDFDDEEVINEVLEYVSERCPPVNSVEKLRQLYDALNDNLPMLADHSDASDNLDDYAESDDGELTPR